MRYFLTVPKNLILYEQWAWNNYGMLRLAVISRLHLLTTNLPRSLFTPSTVTVFTPKDPPLNIPSSHHLQSSLLKSKFEDDGVLYIYLYLLFMYYDRIWHCTFSKITYSINIKIIYFHARFGAAFSCQKIYLCGGCLLARNMIFLIRAASNLSCN